MICKKCHLKYKIMILDEQNFSVERDNESLVSIREDRNGRSLYKTDVNLKLEYLLKQCNLIIRELKLLYEDMSGNMKENERFKRTIRIGHEGPVINDESSKANLTVLMNICLEILTNNSINVLSMEQMEYLKEIATDAISRKIASQKVFSFSQSNEENWTERINFIENALSVIRNRFMEIKTQINLFDAALKKIETLRTFDYFSIKKTVDIVPNNDNILFV